MLSRCNLMCMRQDEIDITKSRLENILKSIRFQNSGADAHTIGNIRHSAQGLLDVIDCKSVPDEMIVKAVQSLEKKVVDFYKNKYRVSSKDNCVN